MTDPTTPTAPKTSAPPAPVEPHPHSGPSPETAKMIAWEKDNLAKGKITPEEATKRFDALNVPLDQRDSPPDTRPKSSD